MEIDNPNIVKPEKIAGKTLLYSEKEKEPLSLLQKLLQQENLQKTQENLAAKAFPKGITVLLHGAPGTGKTEIVKQIAKETGRAIMPVDLSQAKSKCMSAARQFIIFSISAMPGLSSHTIQCAATWITVAMK